MHRRATLDTGCDHSLCHTDVNRFLRHSRKSDIHIFGFSGDQPVTGDRYGQLQVYVMSPSQHESSGSNIEYNVHTVTSLNSDLMSMEDWYQEKKYDFHLVHEGFSGLELRDSDGSIKHRIPVIRDEPNHRWFVDLIIAKNADAAKVAGRHLEQQIDNSPDALARAAQTTLTNTVDNINALLQSSIGHARTIRIRAGAVNEVMDIMDSEVGGVSDYINNYSNPEQPFFNHTCFQEHTEFDKPADDTSEHEDGLCRHEDTTEDEILGNAPNVSPRTQSHDLFMHDRHAGGTKERPMSEILGNAPNARSPSHGTPGLELSRHKTNQQKHQANPTSSELDQTDTPYIEKVVQRPDGQSTDTPYMEKVVQHPAGHPLPASSDPNTAGVKQGMPSRERRLTSLEFHRRSGHIGFHPQCETCTKLRKTLRRVYRQVDPYKDHRYGYTFAMDGITWSDKSKQGNRYTVVLRDIGDTGFLITFHLTYKSNATLTLQDTVTNLRNDPRFTDIQREGGYKLISEISRD